MRNESLTLEFDMEQRILHLLFLNTFFVKEVGLMSGKMGILLALAEYNKFHPNSIHQDFIYDLIDEVLEHMDAKSSIGFSDGLCGIGWGIEWLINNQIIEGEEMNICSELDNKIMEKDIRRMEDPGLENGLGGILYYALIHINSSLLRQEQIPFDEIFRHDLFLKAERLSTQTNNLTVQKLAKNYVNSHINQAPISMEISLEPFIGNFNFDKNKIYDYPLGLHNGLAGLLLKEAIYQ